MRQYLRYILMEEYRNDYNGSIIYISFEKKIYRQLTDLMFFTWVEDVNYIV